MSLNDKTIALAFPFLNKNGIEFKLDPNDYEASLQQYRHYMTISYISGYLIEKTLSVDNLFVMMMIFSSFGVDKKDYQHVLNWGILGAIVLRFVFIFAGAALISRFAWILLVFGGFLVYSGAKMFLNRNKKEEINALDHPVVKFMQRRLHLGPLVMTVVFIEFCDLIFAFAFLIAAEQDGFCAIAAFAVGVWGNLRQGADQIPGTVITEGFVVMDNEIGIAADKISVPVTAEVAVTVDFQGAA